MQIIRITPGMRLLEKFTRIMNSVDLCGVKQHAGDNATYEIEALSVLARFNESHVGMLPEPDRTTIAGEALCAGLRPWHGRPNLHLKSTKQLVFDLIKAYCSEQA